MDQEEKREVLEFLMAALNFSEQFQEAVSPETTIDFKMAESDAMVLYEKYVVKYYHRTLNKVWDVISSQVHWLLLGIFRCRPLVRWE